MPIEHPRGAATGASRIRQINRDEFHGKIAGLLYKICALRRIDIGADDACAGPCEFHHGRFADPGSAAGDQSRLVDEFHPSTPPLRSAEVIAALVSVCHKRFDTLTGL